MTRSELFASVCGPGASLSEGPEAVAVEVRRAGGIRPLPTLEAFDTLLTTK